VNSAPPFDFGNIDLELDRAAEAVVEGVLLGLYQYTPFKTIDRENIREMSTFTILDGREGAVKTSGMRQERRRSSRTRFVLPATSFSSAANEMDADRSGQ